MMKDWRERSNLCCPRGRLGIGTKMIVKPPAANGFTDGQHLGGALRIGDLASMLSVSERCCVSITGASSRVVESQTKLFLRSTKAAAFR